MPICQVKHQDFEFSAEVEIGSPFEKPLSRVGQSQRSMVSRDKAGSRGDRKRSLSDGVSPNNLEGLLPWERELLKRRSHIIPKDGYIPNSVIRKELAIVRPVTPTFRKKDMWTLKPVPEPDPRHMPPGWGGKPVERDNTTLDIFEIARRYRLETMESDSQEDEEEEEATEKEVQLMPCMQNRNKVVKKRRTKKKSQNYESDESGDEREFYSQQRRVSLLPPEQDPKRAAPFTWMDDDEARKSTLNPFQKLTNMVRASSTLSNASSIKGGYSKSSRRSTPVTPRYELKSKKLEFRSLETPDSMRGVRRLTTSGGAQSRERSKSFKLTNMVVDEDSTTVRYKDPSEKRGSMLGLNDMDSIQKLLEEDWFSDMRGTPSFDSIMQRLLTVLDTDDPDLHSKICDYILDLHKDFGIPDMYLDRIIHKLSAQLGDSKVPIKSDNLRTLKQIGGNRPDVLASLLPSLIDSQSDIREETAAILAEMAGVKNKDDLLQLMQDIGMKSKYDSKEEEDEALKALAMRLDIPYRRDSLNEWISNWVGKSSTSLYYDDADLEEEEISKNWDGRAGRVVPESLCITESSSRASIRLRELTNISDKSHQWEPPTPDMGRRQRSGMFDIDRETQDDVPTTPKPQKANIRNSMSDEEEEEYDGFNPKGPEMYDYYKKRYPANIRPGSGRKLYGDEFGGVPSKRLQQFAKRAGKDGDLLATDSGHQDGDLLATDSGHQDDGTDVAVTGSEVGEKVADTTLETMSTQDSGIGKDISEVLSGKSGMETGVTRKGQHRPKQGWPKHSLSPVKSAGSVCTSGQSTPNRPENDKENWQRFFKTSTAQERKRMEMVKRDFDTGKVKQSNSPAVIQYIASDLPLLPGEAGLRLLHTVRVGNKGPTIDYDGRHRVESIPGKLMVQTKNEDTGKSNFGILQMQWTTGVPVATSLENYLQYRQMASGQSERSQSYCTKSCDTQTEKSYASAGPLPNLQSLKHSKKKKKHVKETQFKLPRLHSRTTAHSHDYQWERPLPPPPVRKSSSQTSDVKKQHENYCKYYDLTKKKMQQYTSISRYLSNIDLLADLASTVKNKRLVATRGCHPKCSRRFTEVSEIIDKVK